MRIETIALPVDASCIVVLSMSRMRCVQQLDLGSSLVEVFTSNNSGSMESGKVFVTHSQSYFLIISSIADQSQQSRDNRVTHYCMMMMMMIYDST